MQEDYSETQCNVLTNWIISIKLPGQLVEANVHSLDDSGVYHMTFSERKIGKYKLGEL
ncbi:hypothetical protein JNUCC31_02410 [Paenibacillus sp. JNUCC31]|uniref:hypothetical protein n=1 Tax=Paenibacillus sp. JNUCC-31 TaxID=2777983 RepID=UPI001784C2D7|nr:hypothetical protein [Paenibacillus sp. JNUCC-31]QOS79824.1 hypothetical protein JNUCC31_02410 [Paenibacillus sp. JNUCC-31]